MIKSKTEFDEPITNEALGETLKAVRALQKQLLRDDPTSRAGLVLRQINLILDKIRHGIPSEQEYFNSLLRVAGLAERETDREVVGA